EPPGGPSPGAEGCVCRRRAHAGGVCAEDECAVEWRGAPPSPAQEGIPHYSRNSRCAPSEHSGCFQRCLQKMSKKIRMRTTIVHPICYNSSITAPQSTEICTQVPPIRRRYQTACPKTVPWRCW